MPSLARIAVHPIKALDPEDRERAAVTAAGGLAGDRRYAIVDADGDYVNGKRTDAVHRLRTAFDFETETVGIRLQGADETRQFDLSGDAGPLSDWLSESLGEPVSIVRTDGPALTDSSDPGPTLISRATLHEAASWFPGIDADGMCRRLRPNLVVEGVPAFWEDRLVAGDGARFRIGDVAMEGRAPIPRCVVPTRDPDTGEEYEGFRETFVRNRRETFPSWADRDAFDHLFALMVGVHVPEAERGATLAVGDEVVVETTDTPDGAVADAE